MNPRSLHFRLIMWYAGLLTGVFPLFGITSYQVLRGYLEDCLTQTLLRRSDQIAVSLLTNIDQTGERDVAEQIKIRYAPENYDRFIRIIRPDGSILYASGQTASFDPSGLRRLGINTVHSKLAQKVSLSNGTHLLDITVQGKVSVNGDRACIKQVVVNPLDNANKYTPSGGLINLDVSARENKAVIEVADTGIGIPTNALPHIFERFFRADKARSRDAGGPSLGLAIVKSICLAHCGQVGVQSCEGQGSRFKVELPLARRCKD